MVRVDYWRFVDAVAARRAATVHFAHGLQAVALVCVRQ
jgi:hypothetical protein